MNIIYHLFYEFFKKEKYSTILLLIISTFINIFQINIISYVTANIINSIENKKYPNSILFFKYFILVFFIYSVLYFFYKRTQNNLIVTLRQWIKKELLKSVLIVNNDTMSQTNFLSLSTPINRIPTSCFLLFNTFITNILPNITLLLVIFFYVFFKSYNVGIVFLTGNIIVISLIVYIVKYLNNQIKPYEISQNKNDNYILEILNNIDKIINRNQINNELSIYERLSNISISDGIKYFYTANNCIYLLTSIVFITIFICIWLMIKLFFNKEISSTIFITIFTILLLYREKIFTSIQSIPDIIELWGRIEHKRKTFSEIEKNYRLINERKYEDIKLEFNNIIFNNVTFKYKSSDNYVFKKINLNMDLNDKIIGITGLSGHGKSTFAKLIIKMYKYKGDIYIDNKNIKDINNSYIRDNIVYINQTTKLFDKKIIDNILYGCCEKDISKCNKYLEEIFKYKKIRGLFKNININGESAGSLGEKLSGGQRQIINIISGLISPSKILILDEPTNALDKDLKDELIEVIKYFKKYKKSIIIISHDKDINKIFDDEIKIL
jgi:ABC-type bacteriocin/lantibiotic exporter with double-glycine peptidase domain